MKITYHRLLAQLLIALFSLLSIPTFPGSVAFGAPPLKSDTSGDTGEKSAKPVEKHNIVLFRTAVEKADLKRLGDKVSNALSESAYAANDVGEVNALTQTINSTGSRYRCEQIDLMCLRIIGVKYARSDKPKSGETAPPEELVFATLQANPQEKTGFPALLRLVRYSLKKRDFVYDKRDIPLDPEAPSIDLDIKTATDTMFNGNVGQLTVNLTGNKRQQFNLYLDNTLIPEASKTGSWSSTTLPLGSHKLRVEGPEGARKRENVFLHLNEPVVTFFDTSTIKAPPPPPIFSSPYQLPSWIALGVGLGGIVTGIAGSVIDGSARAARADACADPNASCQSKTPSLATPEDAQKYKESIKKSKKGELIEIIGYTTGAVGMLAAGTLFYLHFDYVQKHPIKKESDDDDTLPSNNGESNDTAVSLSVYPSVGSIYATGTLYF